MKEIKFTLDISDLDYLCHSSYTIDLANPIQSERYEYIKGADVEFFKLSDESKKITVHVVGESYLEALAALQILKAQGYKAVLFFDVAPTNEDENAPCWGYSIFTDMPL
jgi:hypothetical protein